MLVSPACQWRALPKFIPQSSGKRKATLPFAMDATPRATRSTDRCESRGAREGSKRAARRPQALAQNLLHGLRVGEREVFVNLLDLRTHGADQRFRVAVRARDESGERRVLLTHGEVRGGLGIFADLSHHRGSDDADHLEQLWFLHDCEALS